MEISNIYEIKKARAMKNLKFYLAFNISFIFFNILVIYIKDGYSFPENFFAIWPIIGWGVPVIAKFIELAKFK